MEILKGFMYTATAKCDKTYHFSIKNSHLGLKTGSVGLDSPILFKHYTNSF